MITQVRYALPDTGHVCGSGPFFTASLHAASPWRVPTSSTYDSSRTSSFDVCSPTHTTTLHAIIPTPPQYAIIPTPPHCTLSSPHHHNTRYHHHNTLSFLHHHTTHPKLVALSPGGHHSGPPHCTRPNHYLSLAGTTTLHAISFSLVGTIMDHHTTHFHTIISPWWHHPTPPHYTP